MGRTCTHTIFFAMDFRLEVFSTDFEDLHFGSACAGHLPETDVFLLLCQFAILRLVFVSNFASSFSSPLAATLKFFSAVRLSSGLTYGGATKA